MLLDDRLAWPHGEWFITYGVGSIKSFSTTFSVLSVEKKMVLKRDFDRCVDNIRTQIEKLWRWGYPAAAVYSIPGGALKLYGSGAITDVVRVHQEDI